MVRALGLPNEILPVQIQALATQFLVIFWSDFWIFFQKSDLRPIWEGQRSCFLNAFGPSKGFWLEFEGISDFDFLTLSLIPYTVRFQQNLKLSFSQNSDLRPVWQGKGGGLEPEITDFWPNIGQKAAKLVYVVNLVKSTLYYGRTRNHRFLA